MSTQSENIGGVRHHRSPDGGAGTAPAGAECDPRFPPTAAVEAARGVAAGPAVPPPGVRMGGAGGTGAAPEAFAAGAAKGRAGSADDGKPNPAAQAVAALKGQVGELSEYVSYYMAAKADGFKQTIKNVALYAVLGILGAIIGGAVLVTAAVLLVVGIGHGLGELFGGRIWLGDLVVGVVILGGIGVTAMLMIKKVTNNWKGELKKKYEERKVGQRGRFGKDVAERAGERKSPQAQQK